MLSGVLNSDSAIAVNIQIMRVFTKVRQMLVDNTGIRLAIAVIKQAITKLTHKHGNPRQKYGTGFRIHRS